MVDFSPDKFSVSTAHTGTPGTSREIYSEDADGETRTRNPRRLELATPLIYTSKQFEVFELVAAIQSPTYFIVCFQRIF